MIFTRTNWKNYIMEKKFFHNQAELKNGWYWTIKGLENDFNSWSGPFESKNEVKKHIKNME